jgi:NAD(P)-dependent dehydrogenase (short-subunit alcohol dehydrogenase family)
VDVSVRLEGKVAIVTGGAVGIGRATCLLFAREGAAVGVLDRDADAGRACAAELESLGARAAYVQANVASLNDAERAVGEVEARFGGLDVLVNNAGVIGRGTVETTDETEWHRVLDVNLTGVYLMAKAAVPAMRRRGGGSIINVSSAAGLVAWYDQAAYDASKGGVVNLTRSMALDLAGDGIRANCLVPAHVVTPMSEAHIAAGGDEAARARERLLGTIPLGRFSQPEEIAFGALFLASGEASYATGSTLVLDGGYTAR